MNKNTKYKLFKLLNALLAMLLAASVVCVVVASTMTGVLKSQGFLEKKLQTYSVQTAQQLTDEFVKLSDKTGFSQDAYKMRSQQMIHSLFLKPLPAIFNFFTALSFRTIPICIIALKPALQIIVKITGSIIPTATFQTMPRFALIPSTKLWAARQRKFAFSE